MFIITAETGGVTRAKGLGEKSRYKEKERTTACKSQRRLSEMAAGPSYGSGEGGGDEKGRRRGGEERARHV